MILEPVIKEKKAIKKCVLIIVERVTFEYRGLHHLDMYCT